MTLATIITSGLPERLAAGDLILDPGTHVLTGPAGSARLSRSVFAVLMPLMRKPGAVVAAARLIEASWPNPDLEPGNAERALYTRIDRARAVLERVGCSRARVELVFQVGYRIAVEGKGKIIRLLTPAQAALVDQMLAAEPSSEIAA